MGGTGTCADIPYWLGLKERLKIYFYEKNFRVFNRKSKDYHSKI